MPDEGQLRNKLIDQMNKVKDDTNAKMYLRLANEQAIDRTYFHVKPLKEESLANWRAYLEFEENSGDAVSIYCFCM